MTTICDNLQQLSLYDDLLVARCVRGGYGSGATSTREGADNMGMTIIGTDATTTPEGKLRAELVDLLAKAVGTAARRPGHVAEDAADLVDLIEQAHAKAIQLQMIRRGAA